MAQSATTSGSEALVWNFKQSPIIRSMVSAAWARECRCS